MRDLKLAIRQLRKAPVFATVAVLSLALGIGANTAIFTLVNEVLLRSLPVEKPGELVLLRTIDGYRGRMSRRGEGPGGIDPATGRNASTPFSRLIFERLRAQHAAPLTDLFAYAPFSQVNVLVDGTPETQVTAQFVSGNYHAALGLSARVGRLLTDEDDRLSAAPVAVISDRFWETRLARDPAVLGKVIDVNTVPVPIVGVTPPGFEGAMQAGESVEVTVPLAHFARFQPDRAERAEPWYWWLRIMGRLAPGATPAQVRAALEPAFQQAAREGWVAAQSVEPRSDAQPDDPLLAVDPGARGENDARRGYARSLRILMGLVGLVLIAACANVANLLVARGNARRRELALRLALGAGRGRLVRQLFAESLVLACAGAALGVALAVWSRDLLRALRPLGGTTLVLDLPLDGRVLAFTIASAVLTALIFGLAPALRATRVDLAREFQGGPRTLGAGGRSRLGQTLMVVQVALSLVLLICTGLFVRTVQHLRDLDAGFDTARLVLFRIDAASAGYTPERFADLHARIQARLEQAPGVRAATFSRVPLLSGVQQNMRFTISGYTPPPGASKSVLTNGLATNFFSTMGLPVLLGRGFTAHDDVAAPTVAIVNQTFARTYFGKDSPIGRQLVFDAPSFQRQVEIVGVARDAKYTHLRGTTPATVYVPALQQNDGMASFALRTAAADPGAVFSAVRAAVRDIDPTLPVLDLRTQAEQVDRLNAQELLFARLSGLFGATALALACVGLYGLMSHAVLRRTGEIGLRMALGARPAQMLRLVLRESLTLVGLGAALGLAAAYASGRIVATMLFGISATDPLTYATTALTLTLVALLASFLPAWRASRIAPLTALRTE